MWCFDYPPPRMSTEPRELCLRCRRPAAACFCGQLVREPTTTRVVLLQHPREARVAVGTARMAHLSLPNSELHEGVCFDHHPRVEALVREPGTFLLFPGDDSRDPATVAPGDVRQLVVIDGTWPQARKVLKLNPLLQQLPRLGLVPRRPGNYRIRREPTADSLATIEAVVEVLGVLEQDQDRFDRLLRAFTWMVDRQLEAAAQREGPPRHKRPRQKPAIPEQKLLQARSRLVLLHAEVNAHARGSDVPGTPELLHLVAHRIEGERFEAVLAPRRPLAASAPHHLGLSAEAIIAGESVDAARSRWAAFHRPDDLLCAWGPFPLQQLQAEGFLADAFLDLRIIVARRRQASPGAPADALRLLGGDDQVPGPGRAHRTVQLLERLIHALAATSRHALTPAA